VEPAAPGFCTSVTLEPVMLPVQGTHHHIIGECVGCRNLCVCVCVSGSEALPWSVTCGGAALSGLSD